MNSRICRCPRCGYIGQHAELPAGRARDLLMASVGGSTLTTGWTLRADYCGHCGTPYLTITPTGLDVDTRMDLAGFDAGVLRIYPEEKFQ